MKCTVISPVASDLSQTEINLKVNEIFNMQKNALENTHKPVPNNSTLFRILFVLHRLGIFSLSRLSYLPVAVSYLFGRILL
jgi:hypothetical protein